MLKNGGTEISYHLMASLVTPISPIRKCWYIVSLESATVCHILAAQVGFNCFGTMLVRVTSLDTVALPLQTHVATAFKHKKAPT